jgi:hypothetical protein
MRSRIGQPFTNMITKILQKYEGFKNDWYPKVKENTVYLSPDIEKYREGCYEKELELLNKYKHYIPQGWYGFSFGSPFPHEWYNIIDGFLEYLINLQTEGRISKFEIHQIKIKFGGLRFYVSFSTNDEELREFLDLQINKLENHLHDDKLIY